MATRKKTPAPPPAPTKGPPKQYHGTFTLRASLDDLERWKRAALQTSETVSELARRLLNSFAREVLKDEV